MIIKRRLFISILAATSTFVLIYGCSSEFKKNCYIFIGDSMVAGWDIGYYLPYLEFENHGTDGAKIGDLELFSQCSDFDQRTFISLVGTNDIAALKESTFSPIILNEITSSYKLAILKSKATNFIIISILPRNGKNAAFFNQQIIRVNEELKSFIKDVPNAVFLDVFNSFIGPDGNLNMNYSVDGIHLNSYGYELLSAKLSVIL